MESVSLNSGFLGKILGRAEKLDSEGLQAVVQRLAQELNFLETLFNTIEDGVVVVDQRGRIDYFNQASMRLVGIPEDAVGEFVTKYFRTLDWKELSEFDAKGGRSVIRRDIEVQYPQERFLRLFAAPLDGAARGRSGLALVLHDATEVRQKTVDAIESERVHALTLLAASVAHEIGNPLNALHIHIQLMEREVGKLRRAFDLAGSEESPPRFHDDPSESVTRLDVVDMTTRLSKFLDVAKGEINRLDYIITQFLQAIRPSEPRFQLGSLNEVVRETLALLEPELENRGVDIIEKLSKRLPRVQLDGEQIKQVLVNLIKNAMQAMTSGGVLTVQTGSKGDSVWISVGDTGGGIDEEKIKQIFEPYYTTKRSGSGLGLMIVQRIVRDHKGMIDLESHVGKGTVFKIWLPLLERQPKLIGVEKTES